TRGGRDRLRRAAGGSERLPLLHELLDVLAEGTEPGDLALRVLVERDDLRLDRVTLERRGRILHPRDNGVVTPTKHRLLLRHRAPRATTLRRRRRERAPRRRLRAR